MVDCKQKNGLLCEKGSILVEKTFVDLYLASLHAFQWQPHS
jgi:hypothetical protein